jgi:hypothetical protein
VAVYAVLSLLPYTRLQELEVADSTLSSQAWLALADAVGKAEGLRALALRGCGLGSLEPGAQAALAAALGGCGLIRLDLSSNQLATGFAEALAASALTSHGSRLSVLRLARNRLGDRAAAALARALRAGCTLRPLDLSGNDVGCDGAEALAEALAGSPGGDAAPLAALELEANRVRRAVLYCAVLCRAALRGAALLLRPAAAADPAAAAAARLEGRRLAACTAHKISVAASLPPRQRPNRPVADRRPRRRRAGARRQLQPRAAAHQPERQRRGHHRRDRGFCQSPAVGAGAARAGPRLALR